MGSYIYAAPLSASDPVRGSECWEKAAAYAGYTLLRHEEAILRDPGVVNWLGCKLPYGATILDLASGFTIKSRLVVEALSGVSSYIAVDQTEEFARRTAQQVHNAFPQIKTDFIVHDLISGGEPAIRGRFNNPVAVSFGGLVGNGSCPSGNRLSDAEKLSLVIKEIARVFANQNPFFQNSGHILSTWQVCDPDHPQEFMLSIEDSYNDNEAFGDFILNGLQLIVSDLDVDGFDPNAFDFEGVWIPGQMRMQLNAVSQGKQDYTVEGRRCHLAIGERIPLVNSFKFSPDVLNMVFHVAGFGQVEQSSIEGNQISLVLAEAPPVDYRAVPAGNHMKIRKSYPPPFGAEDSPENGFYRAFFSTVPQMA